VGGGDRKNVEFAVNLPICQNFDTGAKPLPEYMAMRKGYLRYENAAEANPKLTNAKGGERSIGDSGENVWVKSNYKGPYARTRGLEGRNFTGYGLCMKKTATPEPRSVSHPNEDHM
jgi:hypothetical protein